ncbi:type I-B CRISPR-associated protein Cas7/Cst2/DevR [Leptolyngbya sp. FACHB-671]|uniref:type I-B CRISPR-associated protein Cas7/Cst2/DevR n=1 Tax=Leptolyngbya sp. FACHB-671 TaxID=2692812 RepID=UPI0016846D5A|nr:type I-B CRISPR-associated protein Cas7/Cst2/DevR [Leptolyngbya sp. FACHB-671]MBD2069540.1 type I-B CRISPR-associated protein Cas7/Cst2/DevR [Leptolyngbya sp. FACHB-671]
MFHLFGNILTHHGPSANNRGENEGNITPLQKLAWQGETHTTVSAEAIRWALRYYWQKAGYNVNRRWNGETNEFALQDLNFNSETFIDDDVLGFMRAEGAKAESADEPSKKGKKRPKGTVLNRRGVLEVTRAVSSTPYDGDITFNAVSGAKNRTSLYGTEFHATRYQYGFAMTPDRLKNKSRIFAVLDGLLSLNEVAGNQARFLYDFAPSSIVLRWTQDFSPRLLYCFKCDEAGKNLSAEDLVYRINAGDIDPKELWVGGEIAETLADSEVHKFSGIKAAGEALKQVIKHDMQSDKDS